MLTSELIQMVKDHLSYDLDNYKGTAPTDAQIVAQLNWAQRTIAKRIEPFDPKITLTLVQNQDTYNLRDITTPVVSKKVFRVQRVMINGGFLLTRDLRDYGLWSLDELQTYASTWITDSADTPTKAVQDGTQLILHPKPSSTFSNNYISGYYLPADLLDPGTSDNTPDLPEEVHEAMALLTAVYASDPVVSEAEGLARLQRYSGRAAEAIEQVALDLQDSRSPFEGTLDSYFRRFMPT